MRHHQWHRQESGTSQGRLSPPDQPNARSSLHGVPKAADECPKRDGNELIPGDVSLIRDDDAGRLAVVASIVGPYGDTLSAFPLYLDASGQMKEDFDNVVFIINYYS